MLCGEKHLLTMHQDQIHQHLLRLQSEVEVSDFGCIGQTEGSILSSAT